MRVAWLTPYLPAPETSGGRIRIAELARGFGPGDELHLFSRLASDDVARGSPEATRALASFRSVSTFPPDRPGELPLTVPRHVRAHPRAMTDAVVRAHGERPFDAIILEHCYARGDRFPTFDGAAIVLDEHNVESSYFRRAARQARPLGLRNARDAVRFGQWRRFEKRVWQDADLITTVSTGDSDAIRVFRPDTAHVVPNGVDPSRVRFRLPSEREGQRVLFLGTMGYDPNIAAAKLLAQEVMPRLRELVPGATLTIAGRGPSASVRELASAHVRVTGEVDDLTALFDEHRVYAMPLSLGAGSNLKTLEPLLAGLPLVASPFAARGHDITAGAHFLEAEGAEAFAARLADVLRSPADFDDLAARGRAAALASDWSVIARRFATLVAAAVDGRARAGKDSGLSPVATA